MTGDNARQHVQVQDPHQDVPIRRWHLEKVGQPPQPFGGPIAQTIGAIRVLNRERDPLAVPFVQDVNGHLWAAFPKGAGLWEWSHITGGFDQPVGVVAVDDGYNNYPGTRPYIFGLLLNGELQLYWWNGVRYVPTTLEPPPGTTLDKGIGAVSLALFPGTSAQPFVVVSGKDRNLWVGWWDTSKQPPAWHWVNLGRPEGVTFIWKIGVVGVTARATGHGLLYIYMYCDDGNVWRCVSDTGETQWTNLQKPPFPPTGTAGVTAVQNADDKTPKVCAFVTDHGQPLYAHVTDSGGTGWHDAGTPPTPINFGLGTALIQPRAGGDFVPAALVADTSPAVWADQADPDNRWSWYRVGDAPEEGFGPQLAAGVIVEEPPGITYTHVFLLGRNGDLYDAWYG
ncbi:hypothetical protein [Nonomuraea guangzhouensis]|uniref:Exo-alpha-sialidase n=1 Tax=Nonomuraea guangzhouensis TaxID=1291555 RepID=A0ABW4GB08_9ACTN|nr:hypothetical protein [Nonomuraea guangzhouensis]